MGCGYGRGQRVNQRAPCCSGLYSERGREGGREGEREGEGGKEGGREGRDGGRKERREEGRDGGGTCILGEGKNRKDERREGRANDVQREWDKDHPGSANNLLLTIQTVTLTQTWDTSA